MCFSETSDSISASKADQITLQEDIPRVSFVPRRNKVLLPSNTTIPGGRHLEPKEPGHAMSSDGAKDRIENIGAAAVTEQSSDKNSGVKRQKLENADNRSDSDRQTPSYTETISQTLEKETSTRKETRQQKRKFGCDDAAECVLESKKQKHNTDVCSEQSGPKLKSGSNKDINKESAKESYRNQEVDKNSGDNQQSELDIATSTDKPTSSQKRKHVVDQETAEPQAMR